MIDSEGTGPIWNGIKRFAKQVAKSALDAIVKVMQYSNNRVIQSISGVVGNISAGISFNNTVTSAQEAKKTHAANVINAGISKSSNIKRSVVIFDENIIPDLNSYQKHCEEKYENMLMWYRAEYSAADDPYKNSTTFDKDISGIPFENLNPYQQQVIINTMPSWDKSYAFAIGLGYAGYAVCDLTQ